MQVGAAIAIGEVILIGYVATPAKTQVLLRRLHEWASARSQPVLAAQGLGFF